MLHGVEWLGRQYSALSKGAAANQSLVQTVTTLAERLEPTNTAAATSDDAASPLQSQKAAALSLKGIAKDHASVVATHASKQLFHCLAHHAAANDDVARALVECILAICTPQQGGSQQQQGQQQQQSRGLVASFGALRPQQQPNPQQPRIPRALDDFLETPAPLHALLPLLAPTKTFYLRFATLQLLALLLRHRKSHVQSHVLTSPGGCGAILECLSTTNPATGMSLGSSAEIIRNEALLLLPHLVDANADIQKLIAFEGAFEKLLDVVAQEGRIEGGVVVQDALEALEALLRYNVSNQNYFRETLSIPLLAPLLFYPPPLPPNAPAHIAEQRQQQLEGFAFQPWEYDSADEFGMGGGGAVAEEGPQQQQQQQQQPQSQGQDGQQSHHQPQPPSGPRIVGDTQKLVNARLVIGIAGLLVQGVGEGKRANQNSLLSTGFFHAMLDLALGSAAPIPLKTQALHVLASLLKNSRTVQDALGEALVTPVEPIKTQVAAEISAAEHSTAATLTTSSAMVEFARLPSQSALVTLVSAALDGMPPPHRPIDGGLRTHTAFRAAAVKVLQAILADNIDARLFVVASMASSDQVPPEQQPGHLLLEALTTLPSNGQTEGFDEYRALFAGMVLGCVIKGSDSVKSLARRLRYASDGKVIVVPESDDASPAAAAADDDDDDAASLLSILIGNITVAIRSQSDALRAERNHGVVSPSSSSSSPPSGPSSTSWTRILLAHLTLLALWLHASPRCVRDLLSADSSNLQAVVQLLAEGANGEALLVGMGAWVLGTLYEWGPPASESEAQGDATNPPPNATGAPTRREIMDLLSTRIGLDQFEAKLERLRDDPRLRLVGPDVLDRVAAPPDPIDAAAHATPTGKEGVAALLPPSAVHAEYALSSGGDATGSAADAAPEVWFDWTWAEFWRHEAVTISNAVLVPPGTSSAQAASAPAELLDAQRQIEQLRDEVARLSRDVGVSAGEAARLEGELAAARAAAAAEASTRAEAGQKEASARREAAKQWASEKEELVKLRSVLDKEVEALRAQLSEVVADRARSDEAHAQEVGRLREGVQAAEARADAAAHAHAQAAAAGKQGDTAAASEAAAAAAAGAAAQERIAALESEIAGLHARLQEAEGRAHTAEGKVAAEVQARRRAEAEAEAAHAKGKAEAAAEAAAEAKADAKAESKPTASASASAAPDPDPRLAELEQENQDLLIMLDELSTKRKRDKEKLREKGEEVSEDEEDDDDEDEEDEE